MLVDFQSRPLTKAQEVGFGVAAGLAIVSAVAFIIFQQLRLSPNLGQALTFSAAICNLTSTSIVLVAFLALSLRKKEKKQEDLPPIPIDEGLGIEGLDDDEVDELTSPQLVDGQVPIQSTSIEKLHHDFMQNTTAGLEASKKFIEALGKSGKRINQEAINKTFPELSKALEKATSYPPKGRKKAIIHEVRHFFYVHGKQWQKEKFFFEEHVDDNLDLFEKHNFFDGEDYSKVLRDALEKAEALHYPYLSAFKNSLNPDTITSEQALADALNHIIFNEEHYKVYLEQAAQQFNRLVGLCFYVPGYVVMRQGFFMSFKVPKFKGYTTQAILRTHEGPYGFSGKLITLGAGGEKQLEQQVQKRISEICGIQIKGRTPLFAGSDLETHLKNLMVSIYLPVLQAVKGTAKGDPHAYDSAAYQVTDVEGYGLKLTKCFKKRENGAWVPKSQYKELLDDPFAPLEKLDPIKEVENLTNHLLSNGSN